MSADHCPHCGASLQGEPIPQEYIDAGYYGITNPSTHYRREIGYSAFDFVQFWICPDCRGSWNRWATESERWPRAENLRALYEAERVA